ncbi:TPA: RNA helicase, partial [Clostridioides difficile]|nr:RNA helicase [Clostridioides difficile]
MRLNFLLDKDWLDIKEQSIIASNENSYVTFKSRDILQLLVTWLFSLFDNL